MRLQLDADIDRKLNNAIKAQPNMMQELQAEYQLTDRSIEALIDVLANKYRKILNDEK